MLKEERQKIILDKLKENDIIQVSQMTDLLDVTDMTIRRDLKELEDRNLLVRIHGGASKIEKARPREFSNEEKLLQNKDLKIEIAKKINEIMAPDQNIFLGAGSTIEYVSEFIGEKKLNIFTNSLYLFRKLVFLDNVNIKLIGGEFRRVTGAFVGPLSLDLVAKMRFNQAFIGVNGINKGKAYTYSPEEGILQKMILDNSFDRYLVADSSKLGYEDLYHFYNIEDARFITDSKISPDQSSEIEKYTEIIR
ncbi:DeoR/GlpR family DNA-binding transcription regulator [Anaerococcus murdochii]|uniref:Lactose phosphotransferase system repressor n=1 Tax=Anaerococcus murdochii TaxID=411577 RepID=A0ABS7SY83_9FIRM|nr:DeoR/GlpR family DNA-binding transcription regulator [Anaerococcus murdochii]MBZ2386494.1 DeoR/GlpR family DNA-binding transcription regulator [Anaerococcus murdochii]